MKLTNLRGYATIFAAWQTAQLKRGLFGQPDTLGPLPGDDPLDYDEWCKRLNQAGVNMIRVRLTGKQIYWDEGRVAWSVEPPPAETFNVWTTDGDDAQIAAPEGDVWQVSNLRQLFDAAERYNVRLMITPFENTEFRGVGWHAHAWNERNGGYVVDGWQVFTDERCLAAAEARIQFIIDAVGERDIVGLWKTCEEFTWLATDAEFWELPKNSDLTAQINTLAAWNERIAAYIHAHHSAPVASGHLFAGSKHDLDAKWAQNVCRVHDVPSVDVLTINWYTDGDHAVAREWLRECQTHYPDKQVVVGQYAPYSLQRTEPYHEPAPYGPSKLFEWLAVCGGPGLMGPVRWPGTRESRRNNWVAGGYADPAMMEIAGVTSVLADMVDLAEWDGDGVCWDGHVEVDADVLASWGDGEHVLMTARCEAQSVAVRGMRDGDYELYLFDWLSGVLVEVQVLNVVNGRTSFVAQPREGVWVGYLRFVPPLPVDEVEPPTMDTIAQVVRDVLAEVGPGLVREGVRAELARWVLAPVELE